MRCHLGKRSLICRTIRNTYELDNALPNIRNNEFESSWQTLKFLDRRISHSEFTTTNRYVKVILILENVSSCL